MSDGATYQRRSVDLLDGQGQFRIRVVHDAKGPRWHVVLWANSLALGGCIQFGQVGDLSAAHLGEMIQAAAGHLAQSERLLPLADRAATAPLEDVESG